MAYKVLIADDQKMIRQMFESILAASDRYELSGSVSDPYEAIEHCRRKKVDVILMDVVMGENIDGIETAAKIKEFSSDTKIVIVTSMPEVFYIKRAQQAGIESFWYKEIQEQPLLEILDRTMAGESVYPLNRPRYWLGNAVSTHLTEKELEVLRELVGGFSTAQIGEKLGISERTVRMHISDMLEKTGFKNRLQLAVRARGGGLIINDGDVDLTNK